MVIVVLQLSTFNFKLFFLPEDMTPIDLCHAAIYYENRFLLSLFALLIFLFLYLGLLSRYWLKVLKNISIRIKKEPPLSWSWLIKWFSVNANSHACKKNDISYIYELLKFFESNDTLFRTIRKTDTTAIYWIFRNKLRIHLIAHWS